jgi:hypothetical protein
MIHNQNYHQPIKYWLTGMLAGSSQNLVLGSHLRGTASRETAHLPILLCWSPSDIVPG